MKSARACSGAALPSDNATRLLTAVRYSFLVMSPCVSSARPAASASLTVRVWAGASSNVTERMKGFPNTFKAIFRRLISRQRQTLAS